MFKPLEVRNAVMFVRVHCFKSGLWGRVLLKKYRFSNFYNTDTIYVFKQAHSKYLSQPYLNTDKKSNIRWK